MKTNFITGSSDDGLVDIIGRCDSDNATEVIRNNPYWKQMYISESLEIPSHKPDVEQINSVDVSVSIIRKQVIKTPRSYNDTVTGSIPVPNLEGKLVTGRKLIIEGQLCQKIVYTALEDSQPVHSVDFYVPFSSFIVVPQEITFENENGTTNVIDSLNVNFDVNACIEDATACVINERTILKQVTLLLYAVPTQSC